MLLPCSVILLLLALYTKLPPLAATIIRGRGDEWGSFFAIISASNPDIGMNGYNGLQQRGACIMRSTDPTNPASWRAWDGLGFNVQVCACARQTPWKQAELTPSRSSVRRPVHNAHYERLCPCLCAH